jgi:2-methylcitrate dehydratase PrpD
VSLGDFSEESLRDPDVLALAERIRVEADDNPDPAAFVPAMATAALADGQVLRAEVSRQFGSPSWPLTREEHFTKARACLAFGGLPGADTALAPIFDRFEQVDDALGAMAAAFG